MYYDPAPITVLTVEPDESLINNVTASLSMVELTTLVLEVVMTPARLSAVMLPLTDTLSSILISVESED
jgi:hypothetical protein